MTGLISGLLVGLCPGMQNWLSYILVPIFAMLAVVFFCRLAGTRGLHLLLGALGGAISGISSAFFSAPMSTFIGRLDCLTLATRDSFKDALTLLRGNFLPHLALCLPLGILGGILGMLLMRKLNIFRAKASLLRGLLFSMLGLVTAFLIGVILPNYAVIQAALTFKETGDYPLYVMHYRGDYGFSDFLRTGVPVSALTSGRIKSKLDFACSCFAALNSRGRLVFGRNMDYSYLRSSLLLFTDPPDGYASVSMSFVGYIMGNRGRKPTWQDRIRFLSAAYGTNDGLNEYGLAVGVMNVPRGEGGSDPQKLTICTSHAMRLILDHAKNVDEAINLLGKYNVYFSAITLYGHLLIADASGNSAVVEFLNGKMSVLHNREPWQVATNFILTGNSPEEATSYCDRYRTAYYTLKKAGGIISHKEAMALLSEISQDSTKWSAVYNMKSGDIQMAMGRDYNHVSSFKLKMKR